MAAVEGDSTAGLEEEGFTGEAIPVAGALMAAEASTVARGAQAPTADMGAARQTAPPMGMAGERPAQLE